MTKHTHIEDSYPLSPMQQGMLFHSLYSPQAGLYIQQLICKLPENLNLPVFQQVWQRLVVLHPILRTSFHLDELGQPYQVVHSYVNLPLKQYNWSGLSTVEQEKRRNDYLQADQQQGFKLTESPLMRLALFRIAEANYQFIWTSHHALLDGRSRFLLLKQLFTMYEAACRGQNLQLTPSRPYRDYIDWLEKQDFSQAEPFWRRLLKGFTASTPLEVDRARSTKFDEPKEYGQQTVRLSKSLTLALKTLTHHHSLTPNTLLQGAWALLLSRYSGQMDVVFGATRACRHSTVAESESMVGLFINTLPMRVHISINNWLLLWLQELRTQWVAMRDYEHTPLTQVKTWSEVSAQEPLFESILVFENHLLNSAISAQDERWQHREIRLQGTTNYPLTITGYLEPELLLEIVYDQHRFDDETISRMLGHLQTLLENMVTNPEQRLLDLPLLTRQERYQMLVEWNSVSNAYPQETCIHQRFEAQVQQTPNAIAVTYDNQQLTYQELNYRANQVAHYLLAVGIGPEKLVGICMERSLEMIIGMLGILKAGGAYVPLDPVYPKERLAFIVADTEMTVIITQQQLRKNFTNRETQVMCLDTDWEIIEQENKQNVDRDVRIDDLAYVIYTSGSTGTPKGVLVTHKNVGRLFSATDDWYHFNQDDVWTLFHSYAFDFSVWEIWGALMYGGRLVIVSHWVSRSPEAFYKLVVKEQVTVLNQTPSAFYQLIEVEAMIDTDQSLALRWVIFGGEALNIQNLQPWFERHGEQQPQLINMYGITETTVHVTYRPITMTDVQEARGSVIGKAIPDLELYVLDQYLQPVPIGVSGELHVGGEGLACGYLKRAELTAERFIPHPFSKRRGARLYKSGDLVRYLGNGELEYLGRIDYQVKVRGFRIELGEIETVLSQQPSVKEAVVLVREDEPDDKYLVAYIVFGSKQPVKVGQLRDFLKQRLPDYMVPSVFVMLDVLPLTLSGKVDRRALPTPDHSRPNLQNTFVPPQTSLEAVLADTWTEVLGLDQVGIYDNFFDLGGHSLLATQVISRLSMIFRVELPLHHIFKMPTVAELAQVIVAYESKPGQMKKIAQLLQKIKRMSSEEIHQKLQKNNDQGKG